MTANAKSAAPERRPMDFRLCFFGMTMDNLQKILTTPLCRQCLMHVAEAGCSGLTVKTSERPLWTSAGSATRCPMFRARAVRGNSVIAPDLLADFTDLPFPDNTFALVVFDPPHFSATAQPDGLA